MISRVTTRRMSTLDGQVHYVEAALRLLQFVEARRPTGRRFGQDADARWASFKGDLRTADRIELLIRDADAEWPGGFGARTVYALRAVAEDEPFGAQWPGLDPIAAEEIWRRMPNAASTVAAACDAILVAWDQQLKPFEVGKVGPTDRLTIAGPSAVAAAIAVFADGKGLDWADQVVVVATPPAHRQVAAAATALLNATRPVQILAASDEPPKGGRVLVSDDADPRDRARVTGS